MKKTVNTFPVRWGRGGVGRGEVNQTEANEEHCELFPAEEGEGEEGAVNQFTVTLPKALNAYQKQFVAIHRRNPQWT